MYTTLFFMFLLILYLKILFNLFEFLRVKLIRLKRIKKTEKKLSDTFESNSKLFIIIPALNEQERISGFILQLIEKIKPHSDLVSKIIITCNDSEKNIKSMSSDNYTWDVANEALQVYKDFSISAKFDIITYSGYAKRPGQINYACDYLCQKYDLSPQDFILLLDVDAILSKNFFECISKFVHFSKSDLAQVPCVYRIQSPENSYEMAAANWQNYFMLSREYGRLIRREKLNNINLALHRNFWYTANGAVIKYSLIKSIDGFVENCVVDDLANSCLFCAKGCRVELLDTFLLVNQTSGIIRDFQQKLFWCSSYFEIFKLLNIRTLNSYYRFNYIFFRFINFLIWLLRAPIILGLFLISFYDYVFLYIAFFSYIFYLISSYIFPFLILPKKILNFDKFSIRNILSIIIYPLVQALVPWVLTMKFFFSFLKNRFTLTLKGK